MLIRGIPVKIKLNDTLFAVLAVLVSLAAGLLLYSWEAGKELLVPLFFTAGLFYVRLLFLLAVPLVGVSLWQGTFLLRRAWQRRQLSPRLGLHYGMGTAGAVLVGIAAGLLTADSGSGVFLATARSGPGLWWLWLFLPPLVVLCLLAGLVSGRMEAETEAADKFLASLAALLQRTGALLLHFLPAGMLLLLIPLLALTGLQGLWFCLKPLLTGLFCCGLYAFLLYGWQLRRCGKNCPALFWHFFRQAVLKGLAACSSDRCAETSVRNLVRLGVPAERTRSIFELGSVCGAAGTGLYCGLLCVSAAQFTGRLVAWELVVMSFAFSILTAPARLDFPGGGLFRGLLLILLLGIPPEGVLPFVIMERFLDGLRTGMNVLAAGVGAYLSDKLRW